MPDYRPINNSSLNTTHSARNLGFIFDEHITFSDQISSVSKSCYYHIGQIRCIRPYLDTKTASTIATSIVHSKLHATYSMLFAQRQYELSGARGQQTLQPFRRVVGSDAAPG